MGISRSCAPSRRRRVSNAGTDFARRQWLGALAAAPLFALGARASAQAPAGGTIKIGLSGPFTGGSAPMGLAMRNGVWLAVSELNFMGGLLGKPIELVERDDQANPEVGGRIAQELIEKERVLATIGIVNTGVGLSSIDHYQKARVPLMIAVSTGTALTRKFAPPAAAENYVFRVSPTIEMEARALADELVRRGYREVAILADATPYGEAGKNDLEKSLAARNIRITGIERFAIGTTDMEPLLARLRAGRPQALLVWGIGPEMAEIAKDRLAVGWPVPLYGGWTFSMANFIDGAGAAGEGALMTQTFVQEGGLSNRNAFLLAYAQQTKETRISSPMSAAQGYDGMRLLAAAIRQAEKADGAAVRAALENLRTPVGGVITTYNKPFTAQDHDAMSANMLVIGVVRGGRVGYAYADDARKGLVMRTKEGETRSNSGNSTRAAIP
jgi:branched-chain amino acid transport system substrate-binding protein